MVGHLVMGVLIGLAGAGLSLALGGALWLAALAYVLGANLGTAASVLVMWLRAGEPRKARPADGAREPLRHASPARMRIEL